MAVDKVQLMRNMLKQIKSAGGEIDFTPEAIDSMDFSALRDYFEKNITFSIPVREYSDTFGYALSSMDKTRLFLNLMAHDQNQLTDQNIQSALDGAFIYTNKEKDNAGIRIGSYGGDLKVSKLSDMEAATTKYSDMQDQIIRYTESQKSYASLDSQVRNTPKPPEPGFFSRLFHLKSYRVAKAYEKLVQDRDHAQTEMQQAMTELGRMQSELAPDLATDDSLFKAREYVPQEPQHIKDVEPQITKVEEKTAPTETQTKVQEAKKTIQVENGNVREEIELEYSDASDQFEKMPKFGNSGNPDKMVSEPDRGDDLWNMAQDQMIQGMSKEIQQQKEIHDDIYVKDHTFETQKDYDQFLEQQIRRFDESADFHKSFLSSLKGFPQELLEKANKSTQLIADIGKQGVLHYADKRDEPPQVTPELVRAVSERMFLKMIANDRVALNEDHQVYGENSVIGYNEMDCKDPESLEMALSHMDSLSTVQTIASAIAENPVMADSFLADPKMFLGLADECQKEANLLSQELEQIELEERIEQVEQEIRDGLENNSEMEVDTIAEEQEKPIQEETAHKPTNEEKLEQMERSFQQAMDQLEQTYYGEIITKKVALDFKDCLADQRKALTTNTPLPKANFVKFAASAILFSQIREEFKQLNDVYEKTEGIATMGKLQSEMQTHANLKEQLSEYMQLPIIQKAGEKMAKGLGAFEDFATNSMKSRTASSTPSSNYEKYMNEITKIVEKEYSDLQASRIKKPVVTEAEQKEFNERIARETKELNEQREKENRENSARDAKHMEELNRAAHGGLLAVGTAKDRKFYDEQGHEVGRNEFKGRMNPKDDLDHKKTKTKEKEVKAKTGIQKSSM